MSAVKTFKCIYLFKVLNSNLPKRNKRFSTTGKTSLFDTTSSGDSLNLSIQNDKNTNVHHVILTYVILLAMIINSRLLPGLSDWTIWFVMFVCTVDGWRKLYQSKTMYLCHRLFCFFTVPLDLANYSHLSLLFAK